MKFKRQITEEDSINLTPLIDVVFLLLIFFMVSTTFTRETQLLVDLPEAVGEPSLQETPPIEILISASGNYSVNGKSLVNADSETLEAALKTFDSGEEVKSPVTITADAKTPHQSVVTAMDVAGQLGFTRLSIATNQPESGEDS